MWIIYLPPHIFMQQSLPASPYLFVYGSLRMGFQNEAYKYISEYFEFVCHAKSKGILYDAGTYPVAKPCNTDNYIIGELYKIKKPELFDWAITQLDDYEGLNPESDEPQFYERTICNVITDKEIIPAHVYWYSGDVSTMPVLPVADVMQYFWK